MAQPPVQASSNLRIGSRGSDLALWQARHVAGRLGAPTDLVIIKTQGDQIQHLSLDKVEGKGFFTKEIEEALLARRVDIAVHSYKDLPIEAPAGLEIAAVPERAARADLVVARRDTQDLAAPLGLRRGARVGTSSLRRKAHLLSLRPDLVLVDLRGNVPTRWHKAASGELDAVILAAAGVSRLGLDKKAEAMGLTVTEVGLRELCPAPAQGALAIQIRADDERSRAALTPLHNAAVAREVDVERRLLARFGGGCHLPLGATCKVEQGEIHLYALVAGPDGKDRCVGEARGLEPEAVVNAVHQQLIAAGAERFL